MRVHPHIPVGEIAAAMPHVTKLFDVLGLDYVLHGRLSLREACADAGLDLATVRASIDAMPQPLREKGWADASIDALLAEVRDHRHPATRAALGATASLFAAIPRHDREVTALHDAFVALCDALQPHMSREEHMLFPVIQHLEDCWTKGEHPSMNFIGGIGRAMAALMTEHVAIIQKLNALRDVAQTMRDDGAHTTRLLNSLAELDHEVRQHVHLENNVLYPRATAVEEAVR